MEIEAAAGFEDAVEFHQARGHHRQIRHHRGGPEEAVEGLHHLHNGRVGAMIHKVGISLRGVGPIPGVGEGVELRLAGFAGRLAEEHVVIGVGIERRVEINEVHAGIGKHLPVAQPLEIVAKQQTVHLGPFYQNSAASASRKTQDGLNGGSDDSKTAHWGFSGESGNVIREFAGAGQRVVQWFKADGAAVFGHFRFLDSPGGSL